MTVDNLPSVPAGCKRWQRQPKRLADFLKAVLDEGIVDVPAIPRQQEVHAMRGGQANMCGIRSRALGNQSGLQNPLRQLPRNGRHGQDFALVA